MDLPVSFRISRVPKYSGILSIGLSTSITGLSPSMAVCPKTFFCITSLIFVQYPTTPILPRQHGFGLIPVRSPLLGESLFVFFSYGYLDVSVPHVRLLQSQYDMSSTYRVAPFGYLRINSYVPIPAACRSLSRPSSPPRA